MVEHIVQNTHHIVSAYDSELKEMVTDILAMSEKVLEMMNFSRKALDQATDEIVTDSKALDKEINALDFGLQKKATKLIALRQPMGVDLRFVVSTLKIASSLERMGDLAKSTCKKANKFGNLTTKEVNNDLREMNALATKMLHDVMIAFRDSDLEKASSVMDQDSEVDDVYHQLLRDVQVLVRQNPDAIPAFADIIFSAKNFERIGDHCTKIADLVHYITSGQYVAKAHKAAKKEAQKKAENKTN